MSALLGTDVPILKHFIRGTESSINLVSQEQVMVVMDSFCGNQIPTDHCS